MAGIHARSVSEGKKDAPDAVEQDRVIAAGEIGAADGTGEERVTDKEILSRLTARSNLEAHAAGTVPWCVVRADFKLAERDHLTG